MKFLIGTDSFEALGKRIRVSEDNVNYSKFKEFKEALVINRYI